MRNRKRGASKTFLRAIRDREARELKARILTINPFEDAARGRDTPLTSNYTVNKEVAYELAKQVIENPKRKSSHGRVAPGARGPECDSVGATKRGRGRPRITEPRPWEVAGISRRTWYRRRDK